jgi:predicted transposase YbfD/YdcC
MLGCFAHMRVRALLCRSMLSRFREAKALELGLKSGNERRPHRASDCHNRHEAERWRQQVIREISKKVSQIQNRTYAHALRDAVVGACS